MNFNMSDPLESFSREHASDDKTRWKTRVGHRTVSDQESRLLQLVSELKPNRKCGRHGRQTLVKNGDCDNYNPLNLEG